MVAGGWRVLDEQHTNVAQSIEDSRDMWDGSESVPKQLKAQEHKSAPPSVRNWRERVKESSRLIARWTNNAFYWLKNAIEGFATRSRFAHWYRSQSRRQLVVVV